MFSAQILNSNALVNDFKVISAKEFIPGEEFTVFFRVIDPEIDLRYVPPATNITTISLNNQDGTTLSKTGAMETDDRSIQSFTVSEVESLVLRGGNFTFSLDVLGDASITYKGIGTNVLSRIVDGDC